MAVTQIDFWYDFASTYSYPSAMRIEALAAERDVAVHWRPFLLGPIFVEQGWKNSPFNIYPVKGRYMWRDMERICARHGLAMRQPDPFPQNSMLAARVTLALEPALRPEFSRQAYLAQFAKGLPISDRATLAPILDGLGLHPSTMIEKAASEPVKQALRMETDEAKRIGIFGAPSFVTEDGELFWGNDRLEEALAWAVDKR